MKRLLALLLLVCGSAFAAHTDLFIDITKDGGPTEVADVVAATPSPLMTGYQSRTRLCTLLVNRAKWDPTDLLAEVMVVHEAGHCLALRDGITNLDVPNPNIEKIADVYAVAWLYKNRRGWYEEVVRQLLAHRAANRRDDHRYNTIFAIRMAMSRLEGQDRETLDPWAFTKKLFAE